MIKQSSFQVPATTANLGPGYDCLGVALRVFNRVTVTRGKQGNPEPDAMAETAAAAFFEAARVEPFPFRWSVTGDVPRSRGLGSSVTVRLGLLGALNALAGRPLARRKLFELAAKLEGHPDNAAPAMFGGFTVAAGEGPCAVLRFPVARTLRFVLLIPNFEIRTGEAREILPATVDRRQAAASAGRACRITAAFASGRYEALRDAFADEAFHQSHRLPLIPFLPDVLEAGTKAGALGGFLSGSGSTIACVTLRHTEAVGEAMRRACGLTDASLLVTTADNRGARQV